jgi:predicted metal-dependent peptidase
MNQETAKRLTKARIRLIIDQPFFGALAVRFTMEESQAVQTMATDGTRIKYNPTFVEGITDDELCAVLCHEVLHCALLHPWRRGARGIKKWNVACDHAVNHVLDTDCRWKLPKGALPGIDDSAEHIFARLGPDPDDQQGKGKAGSAGAPGGKAQGTGKGKGDGDGEGKGGAPSDDPGGCGAVEDAPPEDGTSNAEEDRNTEDDWRGAVISAARNAKNQGKCPAFAERLVNEILHPPVDWRTLLADWIQRSARNDYSWTRPNRRYLQRRFILPSLLSVELPPVVIVRDTSGSISDRQTCYFTGAVSDILSTYPTTVHVLDCDARIHQVRTFESNELPIPQFAGKGGGGTDFRPAFTWMAEHCPDACGLIYLTDLYGTFPDSPPDVPTLWIATTDVTPPWGEVVRIPDADRLTD